MSEVFATPDLDGTELTVVEMINKLRDEMRNRVAEPRRWSGGLRRMAEARAVQASNSIEGYNASLDDVVAAVEGEPTLDASEETRLALEGYRDAMTYVLQIADDETLEIDEGLLKSLHFMMIKHDLPKNPGRWRPGPVFVRDEETKTIVYEGPPRDDVPSLIAEMLGELEGSDDPILVKAAMAHLNLAMIHPFSDGNGRMARCLQTLVLARDQVIAPIFSGIEEFLGRNTKAYYEVLGEVGAGSWNPDRNPRPWIRFCLRAHHAQIRTMLRRRQETEDLWNGCARLAEERGLPERCVTALVDAAHGLRIRRGGYRRAAETGTGDEISDQTATRDLQAMVDHGLLTPVGERRARYYVAGAEPAKLRRQIVEARPPATAEDPFEIVRSRRQLRLA